MATPGRALINPSLTSTDFNVAVRINSLLKILNPQKPDRSNLGLAALNRFSPLLKPSLVIHVIKSQANPHRALFFFNWASNPNPNPNNYSHTHHCYVAITDLLLSHSLFSTAASLLQESNRLNDFLVSRFIAVHGGRGDIGAAMDWFHKAKLIENGKCLFSYNAILGALVRADRMSVAKEIYDQIVKEGMVKPDVSTCSVMINGFCKMGEMENAQKVFDEMICEPDVITYSTMIRGFCKMGDFVSARKVCGQMREKKDCLPNTVTYSILIDGYCKKGELEEAIKCMNEMEEQGCEPNQVTYSALIHGFCNKGDLDSARKVFDKMICEPDVITYNTMILGFCKKGDLDSARKVFDKMICEPDVITYNNMILGFCKKGDLDSARKVFCQMREKKDCLPNTVTYSILIDGYCKKGELEEAMKCMSETEKQGSEPNQISYSILIHCLGKKGDVKNAQKMFKEMICEPNVITYNTMIHGFFKMGDFDSARRVLVQMTESRDCLPDRITCTILIDGYCKKGKSEEAMKCMYEMEKHGCEPDVITYSTMIHGLCRKGHFDSAWRVLGQMRESKDCLPDSVTYTTLIDGYCKKGKLEKVMKCMSEMEKLGCEPNLFSYNALIHGLCLSGQIGEVKEMVTKMRLHCVKDDIVTHMTILKGLCIEGGPDTATKHLKDIVSLGMKPEVAYVVIINEYRKLRKPDGAISLLKEINMRGLELSVSCFNRLLRVLVESGEPERAIFPLKEMHQMGCSPNFFSYNTVICSLCDMRGRMGEVEELVRDMLGNGHELRTNLHGCINKGYCEDGNVNMAVQTFCGTLDNNNIFSLERFSILIKELCAKGMVVESERIFDYMSKKCTVVDVDSYRRVVDEHLCLSGRRKEALDSEAN